jgi:hypothetical protein
VRRAELQWLNKSTELYATPMPIGAKSRIPCQSKNPNHVTIRDGLSPYCMRTSGKRCAQPDCPNKIIVDPTLFDDRAIVGQIANIYSKHSEHPSPRPYPYGKPTDEFINGFDNLILLCSHCHTIVHKQDNTFTAEQLQKWKADHISKNLATRLSVLPAEFETVGPTSLKLYAIDATLKESIPYQSTQMRSTKDETWVNSSTRFKLRFETHRELPIDLDLSDSGPCRIGSRATILLFESKRGKDVQIIPISIYSHFMKRWMTIINRGTLRSEAMTTSQLILFAGLFCVALLTMIIFIFSSPSIYSLVPFLLTTCGFFLFRERAAIKLDLALRDAQNGVRFG